jgi:hypothetical protein
MIGTFPGRSELRAAARPIAECGSMIWPHPYAHLHGPRQGRGIPLIEIEQQALEI